MPTLWNPQDRDAILRRIDALSADSAGVWGRMNVSQMLRHCGLALQMATGEFPIPARKTPFRFFPIKQLIIHVLPFPRGAPTAPSLVIKDSPDFVEQRDFLRREIGKASARPADASWEAHPAFGPLSHATWGKLMHKHLDHHLKQFRA